MFQGVFCFVGEFKSELGSLRVYDVVKECLNAFERSLCIFKVFSCVERCLGVFKGVFTMFDNYLTILKVYCGMIWYLSFANL